MGTGVRFTRPMLERVFKDDYDAMVQFELLITEVDSLSRLGVGSGSITLDTTNFNGLFDSTTSTVQIMADLVDDLTTGDITESGALYFTNERVDDRVSELIQNGTGLTWTYNDGLGTLTGNVSLTAFTTDDLTEGISNLYYTDARVGTYITSTILTYGYEEVSASATVTKTKTVFTGSTASQTITLPTAGTAGREVEVLNNGSVKVLISGSSVLGELYANESACFTDTGSDWIA